MYFLGSYPSYILDFIHKHKFLFLEVYLHRVKFLNFLFRVLFVSFISYGTLNEVCMYERMCCFCSDISVHVHIPLKAEGLY